MHQEAMDWIARWADRKAARVLDVGGRDLNGNPRHLFPGATAYVVIDPLPGKGVDVIADGATWVAPAPFDVVVCAEVLEHAPNWRGICQGLNRNLRPGGRVIVTCAGPGRPVHSGVEAVWGLVAGETYYENVSCEELTEALRSAGFSEVVVDKLENDTRATGVRPCA